MQGEIDFIKTEKNGRKHVVSQETTLAALWSDLTYEARRDIVKEIIGRIDVSKESLHFVVHHISDFSQKNGETLADFPMYHNRLL